MSLKEPASSWANVVCLPSRDDGVDEDEGEDGARAFGTSSLANVGRLSILDGRYEKDERKDGARALGREEEGVEGEKEESRLESNEGFSAITISSSSSLASKWKSSSLLLEASTLMEEGGEEEVRYLVEEKGEERVEAIRLAIEGFSVSSIFPFPSILEGRGLGLLRRG